MESKWFLFPGQTLDNTKISERSHALHISKKGWDGITKHLDRKRLLQEAADKETAVKRYLDEGSKNMTKGWENSLENVRRRKEEERLRLIEQKKDERQQRFLELRKEQEEIRTKYMDKVKKQIFMTTGYARDLTSGLVQSEILFERQKQQEFMNKIKQHEKEVDQTYLDIQTEKAKKDGEKEEEKKKKLVAKHKEYEEELKKIVKEKAAIAKTLRDKKVKSEALDNIEAVKEIEKLEKLQLEEKLRKKKELSEEKKKFLKQQKDLEQHKIKEEKELDEVIQIYQDAKHRIDCMKKEREKEVRELAVEKRQKIAVLVMAEQMDRSEVEELSIKKAMAERDAAEMEKRKARQEYDAKMKQERLKNREVVLAREAEKKKKENELKKWELLNRYKSDENTKIYEQNKKKEMWQKILKYRRELCEQMEDNRLVQDYEKEMDDALACLNNSKDEDTKFFEYADELLQLTRDKGRTTIPIERVISKYVKDFNIKSEKYENHPDKCNKKISDLKKKLVEPQKPKQCSCRHKN